MSFLHNDVWIYRNLHLDCWSIKKEGRVFMYASSLYITNPKFIVWQKSVLKVKQNKRKTPCAFVRGDIFDINFSMENINLSEWNMVKFNPYYNKSFMVNNRPIDFGLACIMIYPFVYVKEKL